jgi:hypothetical protein
MIMAMVAIVAVVVAAVEEVLVVIVGTSIGGFCQSFSQVPMMMTTKMAAGTAASTTLNTRKSQDRCQ